MTYWMDEARCVEVNPDLFFPELPDLWKIPEAKKICNSCPVITECLTYAVNNRFREGIWGGLSPTERNRLIMRKKAS